MAGVRDPGLEALRRGLGEHTTIDELIMLNQQRWNRPQAVEISYSLEEQNIHFDLLLLFT